ncbi:MAG TPA: aminoacyl-histidine dipeptidase [Eubacteriaceae bacterium]|nr:aminoacyl-histidine dipeptidase [Eubacteriaceae bacterium]
MTENTIIKAKPQKVWEYFTQISEIPRGSGQEEKISDYLVRFAEENGLACKQDEYLNVWIKREASSNKKNHPGVILQGHMDMVWEKNSDVDFDFDNQPIALVQEGDFIRAKGTTLGADNGIGMAFILALLTEDENDLPQIEGVITSDEERGLAGALHFDGSLLEGRYFINIDSEDDKEILTSCAGGIRINHRLHFRREKLKDSKFRQATIAVTGLKGGHSGMDIDKNRANANVVAARTLQRIFNEMEGMLIDFTGGAKDNAIPREAKITFAYDGTEKENLERIVKDMEHAVRKEYLTGEENIRFTLSHQGTVVGPVIPREESEAVVEAILVLPNGIQKRQSARVGDIISSVNIGVVQTEEDRAAIDCAARSSLLSAKEEIMEKNRILSKRLNTKMEFTGEYPGWAYEPESPLREKAVEIYRNLFSRDPEIVGVHAGVECGIFKEKKTDLDMISVGPNIIDVHSPDEKLSISSTQKMYRFMVELLKEL